jgi:hypothetical protein
MAEQRHEAGHDALFPEWGKNVKSLLELALEAHGGLSRWSQLKTVTAELSVTGALRQMKGHAAGLQPIRVEAELRRLELTTHVRGQDKHTTFSANSVTLQTEGGRLLQSRENPRSSFAVQVLSRNGMSCTSSTSIATPSGHT